MDSRKLLCIFFLAQLTLVGYAALAVRVGAKLVRGSGFETSKAILPIEIARDYWFLLWVILATLFVVCLWSMVKSGPDWRESFVIFVLSFGVALALAAFAVFVTLWSIRSQAYG